MATLGDLLAELAGVLGPDPALPARAEARDLIAAVLDKPRFWPSGNIALDLDAPTETRIRTAAERYQRGMPMQYAVGRAAFRHLTLQVDERVLIPRPETELLVDLAMAVTGGRGMIADVCTGSGAVALALAAEGSFERVFATDISADALSVAHANLAAIPEEKRGVVDFREGDLLAPLAGVRVGAVVANPPYIARAEAVELPSLVRDWEPHLALFSDDEGMAAIRALVRGAPDVLVPGGTLLLEIDSRRSAAARECAAADGRYHAVQIRTDLTGRERFLAARIQEL
jgi:release factor glutamine methyltransferase